MAITQPIPMLEYRDGVLVKTTPRTVDVTTEVVTLDLHAKARQALVNNATFLANANPTNAQVLAQMRAVTRQINALIRLGIGTADLLTDTANDT